MFQKNAKHRANDASHDVHRTPLSTRVLPDGDNVYSDVALRHKRVELFAGC